MCSDNALCLCVSFFNKLCNGVLETYYCTVRMRNGWEGDVQMEGGKCGPYEVMGSP